MSGSWWIDLGYFRCFIDLRNLFVLPIGGADMPVVSLLNSFTGIAAACGFLYDNQVMLTGVSLLVVPVLY
jgi:NAD(P) transhydrogenase subunit beta